MDNNSTGAGSFEAEFQSLCLEYAEKLPARLQMIEEVWQELLRGSEASDGLEHFFRLLHSLAGSGTTFGFPALSQVARQLCNLLKPALENGALLTLAQRTDLDAGVRALHLAGTTTVDGVFTYEVEPPVFQELSPSGPTDNRRLFLVADDLSLPDHLAQQISYFGYNVRTFTQSAALAAACQLAPPAAVIVDTAGRVDLTGIAALHNMSDTPLPVIFLSLKDDLATRLEAVRTGGSAYLTKPVDINGLVDTLDRLTERQARDPYRVLLVDDDPPLAAHHAAILRQAGMATVTVTDPLYVMAPLIEFAPDLILIDMYMPGCSGLELAAVIRQQEAYISIPIVFLSSETNLSKQLAALHLGGDDFLTKPIQPEHLVAVISSRVERSRTLRSFMVQDSLTGLLNHAATKEQLSTEIVRAQRQNGPLAFALIDIDHFKAVNDTYGHPTGDRVIKSLSRVLKQRLRRTDVVGRYGGEEFAVVLYDINGSSAVRVLDGLRTTFAQIRQQSGSTEFTVTFSCGVATFPHYANTTQLTDAADKALYEAKRGGRNRVVLAQE
jgi:diguanylate cyclase (GGDEF)-like protein